jgi:hypothetical protein
MMVTHRRIGLGQGMAGYYAVLYDNEGPIETGIGRYETSVGAEEEARDWSQSEDVYVDQSINGWEAHNLMLARKDKR